LEDKPQKDDAKESQEKQVNTPYQIKDLEYTVNYPILAYTGPQPRRNRLFIANQARDKAQLSINLDPY
jgi:hypothetical protein